jgi:hypothetical protein
MEHTNTLCGQIAETLYIRIQFVPHRKTYVYYASATETNRLMLFGQTIVVCFENHKEHTNTLCVGRMRSFGVKAGGTYSNYCILKG